MAFNKKTVRDLDLRGKTVLLRVDFNVLDNHGQITEDYRLRASLPTIEYLVQNECRVLLASHAGRPKGQREPKLSLRPIADKLSELLSKPVKFMEDYVGERAKAAIGQMQPGELILLENLRFHPGEEANDPAFAKQLAELAEVFVQDGFGVVHRAHASTEGVAKLMNSVAGLLLEKEVNNISKSIDNPKQPLVVILGGAKVSDKIDLIERFLSLSRQLIIGGAMANTFLKQMGYKIGKSVYEAAALDEAQRLRNQASAQEVQLFLPTGDVAVSKQLSPTAEREEKSLTAVEDDDYILDYGPQTISDIQELIRTAGSVIWNGPVGMTEFPNFTSGSLRIAETIKDTKIPSLAGGGDTVAFLDKHQLMDNFSWVSTGGGATLELMAGKKLPGIEVLPNK